jgi:long-subunit fatty acid transport protein
MKNIITLFFVSAICFTPLWAQNETNVQDISQYFTGGTARGISLNGAYGALGGDMTSLSINPAGIGVYRSSEFVFTPSFSINNVKSNYYNGSYEDSKNKMNISNMGLVFAYSSNRQVGWVGVSLGFAYNRLIDFNRNITIQGINSNSSYLDDLVYRANGYSPDQLGAFYEGLAFDTYAIDTLNTKTYFSDFDYVGYHQDQSRIINTKGGVGEYAFSLGANYSNKLYLGITFGVQRMLYEENKVHEEYNINSNFLSSFRFSDNYYSTGTGYNFKLGAIYKPLEFVRLGFAFHSPTFYNIESEFDTEMSTSFNTIPSDIEDALDYRASARAQLYDFNVTSPLKMIFSAALQNQYGLLSFDYEYVDYSKSKIRGDDDPFSDINGIIQKNYRQTGNFKLGGELKLDEFSLRGGYGFYGSPFYSGHFNKKADTQSYSFGVGYRGESMFVDFGYIAFITKSKYRLYSYEGQVNNTWVVFDELADIDTKLNRFVLTVGFKF